MTRAILLCAAMACAFGSAEGRVRRHHVVPARAHRAALPLEVAAARAVAAQQQPVELARRQAPFLPADLPAYSDPDAGGVKVKLHATKVKVSAPIDLNIVN